MKKILSVMLIVSALLLLSSCNSSEEDVAGRKQTNDNQENSTSVKGDYSIAGVTGVYNLINADDAQAVIFSMQNDQKNIYGIVFENSIDSNISFVFEGTVSKTGTFTGRMMTTSATLYDLKGKFQGNTNYIGLMSFVFDINDLIGKIPLIVFEGTKIENNPISTAMLLEFENAYNDFQSAYENK